MVTVFTYTGDGVMAYETEVIPIPLKNLVADSVLPCFLVKQINQRLYLLICWSEQAWRIRAKALL